MKDWGCSHRWTDSHNVGNADRSARGIGRDATVSVFGGPVAVGLEKERSVYVESGRLHRFGHIDMYKARKVMVFTHLS
jgi:hypothetical protein